MGDDRFCTLCATRPSTGREQAELLAAAILARPELRVFRMSAEARLPQRSPDTKAARYDLFAAGGGVVPAGGSLLVPTDLALAVPEGCYGRLTLCCPGRPGVFRRP